ncbi:hypothetical protein AZKH_4398 [Azoarcus sp. KH32C]|nr:hypothetical protein AZKH_4398 [Azoarcus sp. KH32C]
MSEVDQAENAVNHGVTQRHQRIHAADDEAIDHLLQKDFHFYPRDIGSKPLSGGWDGVTVAESVRCWGASAARMVCARGRPDTCEAAEAGC